MIAFIITLALTLYMTGMIWSMQILEYPLFALVGQKESSPVCFHRRTKRRFISTFDLPSQLHTQHFESQVATFFLSKS